MRAQLLHAQQTSEVSQALTNLNRAVDGLRQAGTQDFLPRGLLARAEYYRVTGNLNKAQKDVDEAFSIASRGGMGLYLADCHLEYARLYILLREAPATKRPPNNEEIASQSALAMTQAREYLKTAKEMIEKMGYHRRDREVEELEEQLTDLSLEGALAATEGSPVRSGKILRYALNDIIEKQKLPRNCLGSFYI